MKGLGLCMFLMFTSNVYAREVEATKDNVPVFAEAKRTAEVLTTLSKGDKLQSKERIGMYWEVQTKDNKQGFVNFMSVKLKDEEDPTSLSQSLREAVQKRRKEGDDPAEYRSRATAMGVRGLQEKPDLSTAGNKTPNFHGVFLMESLVIPKSEIETIGIALQEEIEHKQNLTNRGN